MTEVNVPVHISKLESDLTILLGFLCVIAIIHFFDSILFGGGLKRHFGLIPKTPLFNPLTCVTSSVLHRDRSHLSGNLVHMLGLGFLTMLPNTRDFFIITIATMFITGFGTWSFGKIGTNHFGASGLVFGYYGFLLARGFFTLSVGEMLWALAILLIPQWLIPQIWPRNPQVSKTSHFFGFLAGIFSAWFCGQLP